MRSCFHRLARLRSGFASQARRFGADTSGVTAIEFAVVATPFFAFLMGIMTIGTQYMTAHFIEHGVEIAARKLRTGEAQKAGLTQAQFRSLYCDAVGFMIDCDEERLVIHINSEDRFADLPQVQCMTDGQLTPPPGNPGDSVRTRAGDASKAVKVNVCYDWQLGLKLWQSLWRILDPDHTVDGKTILSAATAFRSEPYE